MNAFPTIESAEEFIAGDEWRDKSLRVFYNKNNPNNCIRHIRGRVDGVLVVRRWFVSRGWDYRVVDKYELFAAGEFTVIENKPSVSKV